MRRQEQALVQQAVLPHRAAALAADARRGQLIGGVFHQIRAAGNIAAGRGQSAARIFDQRPCNDVRADLRRLDILDELTVAVIHHDRSLRVCLPHGLADLPDLRAGQGLAHRITAAALDEHQLDVLVLCRLGDRGQVGRAVLEVNLLVADAVALHAAAVVAGDRVLERVIGGTGDRKHGIPGLDRGKHGAGQRVCAVDKADAHERSLGAENVRINVVERVAAVVVVTITGCPGEQVVRHAVFGKCRKHLFGIPVADLLDAGKIRHDFALSLLAERADFF